MTREEAIAYGKRVIDLGLNDETQAFCTLAISALSAEGDLISRQAVLDGIEELKRSPWATDTRGTGFEYLIAESLDVVSDLVVKQMPSAEDNKVADVLDKISAEIDEKISHYEHFSGSNTANGLMIAKKIIGKYKAESEVE